MVIPIRKRRRLLLLAAVATALAAGGCQMIPFLFAPRHPKKTIKAQYHLEAERLVIIPYVSNDILFEYPTASIDIATAVMNHLGMHLNQDVHAVVHPLRVARWQEANLEWPNMSLEDIAKAFQADALLYVEVERYTMVEEFSANLLRGHVRARVQVVRPEADRNPVFETSVETLFPEDRPVGVMEVPERKLRQVTTQLFARDVVRPFYTYEVEVKGGRE